MKKKSRLLLLAMLSVLGNTLFGASTQVLDPPDFLHGAPLLLWEGATDAIGDGQCSWNQSHVPNRFALTRFEVSQRPVLRFPKKDVCPANGWREQIEQVLSMDLAVALVTPTFNGIQKILEGNQVIPPAAILGEIALATRIVRNGYNQIAKNGSLVDAKFFGSNIGDLGTLGSNFFLYRGFQDREQMERFYYSLLKLPSVLQVGTTKVANSVPSQYISEEGFEFLRISGLFFAEVANVYFKHKRLNGSITAVIVFKLGNHIYELSKEIGRQDQVRLTPALMRSAALASIFAIQAPLQYSKRHGWLGLFLSIEYIFGTLWSYYHS